jgi:hypothetical protein
MITNNNSIITGHDHINNKEKGYLKRHRHTSKPSTDNFSVLTDIQLL